MIRGISPGRIRGPGVLAAAAGVLLLAACPRAPGDLPDVTFTTSQNERVRTLDLRGDVAFVYLWAIQCEACGAMRSAAERLNRKFTPHGVRFVGVDEDESREPWYDWLLRNPSPAIEVWDERRVFRDLVGATALPAALLVDRNARIRARYLPWNSSSEEAAASDLAKLLLEK